MKEREWKRKGEKLDIRCKLRKIDAWKLKERVQKETMINKKEKKSQKGIKGTEEKEKV